VNKSQVIAVRSVLLIRFLINPKVEIISGRKIQSKAHGSTVKITAWPRFAFNNSAAERFDAAISRKPALPQIAKIFSRPRSSSKNVLNRLIVFPLTSSLAIGSFSLLRFSWLMLVMQLPNRSIWSIRPKTLLPFIPGLKGSKRTSSVTTVPKLVGLVPFDSAAATGAKISRP